MCTNVITSLPISISTGYYAQKGMHFPTKLNVLKEDLIRVTASVQRHDKILADIRVKAGIPTKGSGQEKAKMSGPNKPIPKKARFGKNSENGGNPNRGPPSNDHTNKLCQLCAKHSPGCKNTHNTAQCRKWNADGTHKGRAAHRGTPRNTNAHSRPDEDTKAVLGEFKHLFADTTIEKIAQNLKYDLKVLLKYDIQLAGPQFDTMLAHYLANPDGRHSMDILSEKYLNYKPVSITELIGKKGKGQLNFRDVPLEKATEYAAEDADITFQLKEILQKELIDKQVAHLMQRLEMPLVPVLADMEMEGIRVDADFLNIYSDELKIMSNDLEKIIYEKSGCNFNIASPKQMGEVLFVSAVSKS